MSDLADTIPHPALLGRRFVIVAPSINVHTKYRKWFNFICNIVYIECRRAAIVATGILNLYGRPIQCVRMNPFGRNWKWWRRWLFPVTLWRIKTWMTAGSLVSDSAYSRWLMVTYTDDRSPTDSESPMSWRRIITRQGAPLNRCPISGVDAAWTCTPAIQLWSLELRTQTF